MRRCKVAIGLALAVISAAVGCARPEAPVPRRHGDVHLRSDTEVIEGTVPSGATLASVLAAGRLRGEVVTAAVTAATEVFDPRRLRAGHAYRIVRTLDGGLRRFECEIDADRFLRLQGDASERPDVFSAELVWYERHQALVALRGEITREAPSLFEAMDEAHEGPDLSIELADIFGGEIDFNVDLQLGDAFSLAFEKVYREGRFSRYGAVLGAEFENSGRRLTAVRFTVPAGKPAYYDLNGRSLRRFFLKSPLKFAAPRVSSGFTTARLHPVLRIVRPHLGVDYAAPAGSPVVAVAAGTVVSAGWNGEAGRMIHLRHASGYETYYLHLSSIARGVVAGGRVGQGEVIGLVGASGLATGPHLDYRVRKGGVPVNPLVVHRSLPPGEPIPAACMVEFEAERDRVLALLVRPSTPGGVPAAGGSR